jgi:hypothetical protein
MCTCSTVESLITCMYKLSTTLCKYSSIHTGTINHTYMFKYLQVHICRSRHLNDYFLDEARNPKIITFCLQEIKSEPRPPEP